MSYPQQPWGNQQQQYPQQHGQVGYGGWGGGAVQQVESTTDRLAFIKKVYAYFAGSVLLSAVGAMVALYAGADASKVAIAGVPVPPLVALVASSPWIALIAMLGVVFGASAVRHKPGINVVALFGMAFILGIIFAPSLFWAQVSAGDAALGAVIKAAKEQLRALPDGITYGLLRYLNPEVDLAGAEPVIGFNYLGRLGGAGDQGGELWLPSPDAVAAAAVTAAVPLALAHTVTLNAGVWETGTGTEPRLQANWTWASSMDDAQIGRLSQLWIEALTGICAHVRCGGGGLTPTDILPASLTQHQIDELERQHRVADVLRADRADSPVFGCALSDETAQGAM